MEHLEFVAVEIFLVDFTMDLLQRCQGCELLSFNVAKGKSRIFLYLF
jgi:hypothetical protein